MFWGDGVFFCLVLDLCVEFLMMKGFFVINFKYMCCFVESWMKFDLIG